MKKETIENSKRLRQEVIDAGKNSCMSGEKLKLGRTENYVSPINLSFTKFKDSYDYYFALFISDFPDATEKIYLKELLNQYEYLMSELKIHAYSEMAYDEDWELRCTKQSEIYYKENYESPNAYNYRHTANEKKQILQHSFDYYRRLIIDEKERAFRITYTRIIEFIDEKLKDGDFGCNTKKAQINNSDTKIVDTNYFKNFTIGEIDFILNRLVSEKILITTSEIFKAMLRNDKDVKGHVYWLLNSTRNKPDQTALGEFFKNLQCLKGKSRPTLQKEIIDYWVVGGTNNVSIKANFKNVMDDKMTENVSKVRAIFEELKSFIA